MQLTAKLDTTWKLFVTRLSSTECSFTFSSTVFNFAVGSPHAVIRLRLSIVCSFFADDGICFSNSAEVTLVVDPVSINAVTRLVPTVTSIVNGLYCTLHGGGIHVFVEVCPYAIISVRFCIC